MMKKRSMFPSWSGDEFTKECPGIYYTFGDALQRLNGCLLEEGPFEITPFNRAITMDQKLPFYNLEEVGRFAHLLMVYNYYYPAFLRKMHYAFSVVVDPEAEVSQDSYTYFTDRATLGPPILIQDLPFWSEEAGMEQVEINGYLSYYAPKTPEEVILTALERFPVSISVIQEQTPEMWMKVLGKEYNEGMIENILGLFKYCRVPDPDIYRMGIALQLEPLDDVMEITGGQLQGMEQILHTAVGRIKRILIQTPKEFRDEIFDGLPENIQMMLGPIDPKVISGEELRKKTNRRLDDQYLALLPPDFYLGGQPVSEGYNRLNSNLCGTESHGFWITTPVEALRYISSYQREKIGTSKFTTRELHYYFSHFSFVSLPREAEVMKLEDPRFSGFWVTDRLYLNRFRPLEQLYLFRTPEILDELCEECGDLMPLLRPVKEHQKFQACRYCPKSVLACPSPPVACYLTAVQSTGGPEGLLLYPIPPPHIQQTIRSKYGKPIESYLPL